MPRLRTFRVFTVDKAESSRAVDRSISCLVASWILRSRHYYEKELERPGFELPPPPS